MRLQVLRLFVERDARARELDALAGEREVDALRGELAHLRGVHGLAPAVDAVAPGEELRVAGAHRLGLDDDAARLVDLDAGDGREEVAHLLLARRLDDRVAGDDEVRPLDDDRRAAPRGVGLARLCAHAAQPRDARARLVGHYLDRRGLPEELDRVLLGERVLVLVGGHLGLPAPVDQHHALGPEPPRLRHGVNGRVARADDGDRAPQRHRLPAARLDALDDVERVVDALQLLAGHVQPTRLAEAHAEEDAVVRGLQLLDRDVPPDLRVEAELDAEPLDLPRLL